MCDSAFIYIFVMKPAARRCASRLSAWLSCTVLFGWDSLRSHCFFKHSSLNKPGSMNAICYSGVHATSN